MQGIKVPFKIKHLVISSILGIMVFLCLASFAFADNDIIESSSNNVVSELLDQNYKNPEILNLAKSIKASTATTYDLDDIYNIVEECANALVEYDGSEFVSVTEYVHACLTGIASGLFNGSSQNPYLGTINSNIASIQAAVYGPAWDGSGVTNSLWNALQTLYSVNHADQLAQMAKQQGIIDALVGNTQYSLSSILNSFKSTNHSDLDKIYNRQATINTSINNLASSFDYITWLQNTSGATIRDKNFNVINSPGSYYPIYYTFNGIGNGTSLYRFHIYYTENYGNTNLDLQIGTLNNNVFTPFNDDNIFYTYVGSNNGFDIYVYSTGFAYLNVANSELTIKVNRGYLYSTSVQSYYLPVGSKDFNDALTCFTNLAVAKNTKHIDSDLHYQNNVLDRFKELYASDDLIAAKSAQQGYEDQALSDFTGSGSAAAKGSDLTSAKQISGSVKSGLNSGGSVNNGLSGFSASGGLYSWFTHENYNLINNLYVPNQRNIKSNDNYDMSAYENNYQYILDNLGDDQR